MIIYGWRRKILELATATYLCGQCQNPTAHALRRAVTKLTLFWIPLFPISSKYFTVCTFCGATNKLTKAEAEQVQAMNQPAPQDPVSQQQQQFPQQQQFQQQPPMGRQPYPPSQPFPQQQPGPYQSR